METNTIDAKSLNNKPLDKQPTVATHPASPHANVGQAAPIPNSAQVTLSDTARKLSDQQVSSRDIDTERIAATASLAGEIRVEANRMAGEKCLNQEIDTFEKIKARLEMGMRAIIEVDVNGLDEAPAINDTKGSLVARMNELSARLDALLGELRLPENREGTIRGASNGSQLAQAWAKTQESAEAVQELSKRAIGLANSVYGVRSLDIANNLASLHSWSSHISHMMQSLSSFKPRQLL